MVLASRMTRSLAPGQFIGGSVMEEGGGRIGNMLIGGIDTVLSPFARFSGALEDTTKLAAFKTLRKQGIDPQEAAWLTRKFGGSPDFAVRGRYARGAGSMVLFFNAKMHQDASKQCHMIDTKEIFEIHGERVQITQDLFSHQHHFSICY